ncbi:MAG: periplasmic heavy metal sensor [Gemmatimonadota bacterium]|nr:periplasmic heavy metal sensor [Gemmatimonadota bacterium]
MLNRSKLFAAGLLTAAFLAGAGVGGAVSAAWGDRARGEPRRPEGPRPSYAERLQQDLTLTPTQRDTVERIVIGYQGAMESIWTEVRPRMDSVRLAIRTEILAVLDSAQQERFRALIARGDSARAREREGHGGRR